MDNRNAVFIDDKGGRHQAVVLTTNGDGSAELTYQAGGRINTVTAVLKNGGYHEQKPKKEQVT